jgi:hypothetical protein
MATFEIEESEWKGFFDGFSRRHAGWHVTLELLAARLSDQTELLDMTLMGISESSDPEQIEIRVCDPGGRQLTHTIDAPRQVWLKQESAATEEVLEIISDRGTSLLFCRP